MSFTAEELMTMQDEAEQELANSLEVAPKIDDSNKEEVKVDDLKKEGDDGNKKEEGGKEGDLKEGGDSKKEEGEVKAEVKPAEKKEEIQDDEEVRELRTVTRAQKVELDKITKEYERLNKLLESKGLVDEDDKKLRSDEEIAARASYEKRLGYLGDMLEVMKVNPKFEDVEVVVSQRHFDDMVVALAKYHVSQKGGDATQVMSEVEREIWSLANPYKYMYDMIKKYHPDYVQVEEPVAKQKDEKAEGKQSVDEKKSEDKKEDKKPKDQAMSLQDLPGGSGKDGGGWTSAKIDGMDEEELSKVPKDIYEKYLKNDLP
jgi:hypothetical protein